MLTKPVKNGFKTKSKMWQVIFEIGWQIDKIELINPPKEISGKNTTIAMFANNEYRLKVLK